MTILKNGSLFLLLFFIRINANGQALIQMRMEDRIRIAEAMRVSELYGEKIWSGFNVVPFTIILVTDSVEFLINHPSPSNDFILLNDDSLLSSNVYYRKTTYSKKLLATFPAVKGRNTIVIGTPENTGKNTTDWIITLLHEHFHQYANSGPNYYSAVDSLKLSRGDRTGMWMLNYPFPYSDSTVVYQYKRYISAIVKCLADIDSSSFHLDLGEYLKARRSLQQALNPADYRYFSFQIWQEGIARYSEYKFLDLLKGDRSSKKVSDLFDFVPFDKYQTDFYQKQINQLKTNNLEVNKRVCFYAVGFAEGLILDKLNPSWRDQYLANKFFIEKYSKWFDLETN